MKSLWQVYIYALQHDFKDEFIFYDIAQTYSPYAQVTLKGLSPESNHQYYRHVAVNPFCSHERIFCHLLNPKNEKDLLLRAICDMIFHHIAKIDALFALTKKDFFLRFLYEDLENFVYGGQDVVQNLNKSEKYKIVQQLYRLYETNAYEECLTQAVSYLYPRCMVCSTGEKKGFLYLNCQYEEKKEQKIQFLLTLFTQADSEYDIYWDIPPAVIGEEWMVMDQAILAD